MADDNVIRCDLCGEDFGQHKTPFSIEVEDPAHLFHSRNFCSWDHLAAWTAKGEPDFVEYDPSTTLGDRAWIFAVWLAFVTLCLLIVIGSRTVLGWIF